MMPPRPLPGAAPHGGSCSGPAEPDPRKALGQHGDRIVLCRGDTLPDGGARGFDPLGRGHDTVFVVRQGAALHAYLDLCPHYGNTRLPWRKDAYLDAAGEAIVCAAHGARFDIATGRCTLGPCLGKSLTRVPLELNDEGELSAALDHLKETSP
jgi:nitrite reductase/ring-hydroxylating ferredoxin subunit